MPLTDIDVRYREYKTTIDGYPITLAAFTKPDKPEELLPGAELTKSADNIFTLITEHHNTAIISLSEAPFTAFSDRLLHGYHSGGLLEIPDYFEYYDLGDDTFGAPTAISPDTYDHIHTILKTIVKSGGEQVAIHCGSSVGRTATVIGTMLLRAALEKNFNDDPLTDCLTEEPVKTREVVLEYGDEDMDFNKTMTTPGVMDIINLLRAIDPPGCQSIETSNDVRTLEAYEAHIKQQLAQKQAHTLAINTILAYYAPHISPKTISQYLEHFKDALDLEAIAFKVSDLDNPEIETDIIATVSKLLSSLSSDPEFPDNPVSIEHWRTQCQALEETITKQLSIDGPSPP